MEGAQGAREAQGRGPQVWPAVKTKARHNSCNILNEVKRMVVHKNMEVLPIYFL